jgi:hypothetical protein
MQYFTDMNQPQGLWSRLRWLVLGNGKGRFPLSFRGLVPSNQQEHILDKSLIEIAMEIPHLNTVISTGAELFSMMDIRHVDKNGDDVKTSAVLPFLANPNPLQNQEQLLYEFYIQNGVFNQTFQFMLRGVSSNIDRLPERS